MSFGPPPDDYYDEDVYGGYGEDDEDDIVAVQGRKLAVMEAMEESHANFDGVFVDSEGGVGCCLVAVKYLPEGATVFKEDPLLIDMPNGWCKYCQHHHEELISSGFLDNVKPLCKKQKKFLKLSTPIMSLEDIGEFEGIDFEPKKLRVLLQFLYELGNARTPEDKSKQLSSSKEDAEERKKQQEDGTQQLSDGEERLNRVYELHNEETCTHLKVQKARESAEAKMLKHLPKKFDFLKDNFKSLCGIIDTNVFEVASKEDYENGISGCGLYMVASMINHCCEPNCYYSFDPNDYSIRVKTLRPIIAGEAITITYSGELSQMSDPLERIQYSAAHLGFVCRCRVCK